MDMLRYHMFTIGHSWVSEYGSSADPIQFSNIFRYSPLHNIKFPTNSENQYPAVLVTTSDHDDRVVPSHSYKYTAELQHLVGAHDKQVTETFTGLFYYSFNLCIKFCRHNLYCFELKLMQDMVAGHP